MHSRTCMPPKLGQHAADTVYPIRVLLPPGILAYKQRVLHYSNFAALKSNTGSSAVVQASTQHSSARYCELHIAVMIPTTQRCAVLYQRNLQAQQPTTNCVIRAGKKRRFQGIMRRRYSSEEEKIEDRDRDHDHDLSDLH